MDGKDIEIDTESSILSMRNHLRVTVILLSELPELKMQDE